MHWTPPCTPLVLSIYCTVFSQYLKPTPQPPLGFGPIPVDNPTSAFMSNASDTMRGFPSGCFYIRAAFTQRYWTMRWGETHQDGNGIDLDVFAKPGHEQVCKKIWLRPSRKSNV